MARKRSFATSASRGAGNFMWQPPEVSGEAVHWLASCPEMDKLNGQGILAQERRQGLNLPPSWKTKAEAT